MSRWWSTHYDKITPVEVERATEQSVFIAGKRRARVSHGWGRDAYFETWDAARDYIMADAVVQVTSLRRQLERANGRLGNIKGLKAPVDA